MEDSTLTPREKIAAVISALARRFVYYRTALYSMSLHEVSHPGLIAAISQSMQMYYNPEIVASYSPKNLAGLVIHELLHPLLKHFSRARAIGVMPESPGEVKFRWNIAADLEINTAVQAMRLTLPEGAVFPSLFDLPDDKHAEYYFRALKDNPKYRQMLEDQQGTSGGGDNNQKQSGQNNGGSNSGDQSDQNDYSSDNETQSGHQSGSGADGIIKPFEKAEGNPNQKDRKHGLTEAEIDRLRHDLAAELKKERQRSRGNLPAALARLVDELAENKVDWRHELAARIRMARTIAAGRIEPTYNRPARREHDNFILPGYYEPRPSLAVVIDTSASISKEQLKRSLSEIQDILRNVAQEVDVYTVDANVHSAKKVSRVEDIDLVGGGGTDMRAGINRALEENPDAILVFTDGYTPWPDSPPEKELIVVLYEKTEVPDWLEDQVIVIND